jgi:predicted Rossmann fold flavoprotein
MLFMTAHCCNRRNVARQNILDAIVVGGGAAGLFCAAEAARRGRTVAVLERNQRLGRKIAISGGGRCNFTNVHAAPESFYSENLDFCRSALARFGPAEFVACVERRGIAYHEKKLGQLFCDGSAEQIVDMLRAECTETGVDVRVGCDVLEVTGPAPFRVRTASGELVSKTLVLATGGLSIPKLGATDFAYRIARQFGLAVVAPRPGLVPLTLDRRLLAGLTALSGISFSARVGCAGAEFREHVLVTHRGLSGPAILQLSSYWRDGEAITIDLLPDDAGASLLLAARDEAAEIATVLARRLPRRFARAWSDLAGLSKPMNRLSARELSAAAEAAHDWRIVPSGTEGFAKAEVTVGGIDTRDLSSKTMAALRVDGLFAIGEAVDVTGHLGGFNFQWAWASAYAAAQAL